MPTPAHLTITWLLVTSWTCVTVAAQGVPDPAEGVRRLRAAFGEGGEEERVAAILACADLRDERIVREIRRGFRQSETLAVRQTAIDTLGRLQHPEALKALHDLYRRDRDLASHEELFGLLLKSIGRHGSKSSLPILKDSPFRHLTVSSGTARIMGMGNIRERQSIEELIRLARKKEGNRRIGVAPEMHGKFRKAFRVALVVLTGVDQGLVPSDWARWWQRERSRFEMPPGRPPVTADVRDFWQGYWGEAYGPEPSTEYLDAPPFDVVASPTKERVAQAIAEIRNAFASKDYTLVRYAIEHHGAVAEKRVIHDVARAFRLKDRSSRTTAMRVLGWNPSRYALRQLHREFRRHRDWDDREEEFATLLKAIGRHGDPSSVRVLISNPFRNLTIATGRARAMGLGRIRDRAAVETIIKAMSLADNPRTQLVQATGNPRFMDVARISLISLTGQDFGEDKTAWQNWWRENKRDFRVSRRRHPLPPVLKRFWEEYWKEPYETGGVTK